MRDGGGALEAVLFGTAVLVGSEEVVVATDADGRVTWVSPTVDEVFGWTAAEFADGYRGLIHPDDAIVTEAMSARVRAEPGVRHLGAARHRARDGAWLWLEVVAVNLLDTHGVVLTRFRDVSGTKQAERAVHDLARDELTGLVTRRLIRQALEDRLATGPALAVLFCDLDGFKAVNAELGHAEGDRRLQALGQRLRRWQTVTGSLVGRWGGDEFVALAEVPSDGRIAALVDDLATAVGGDERLAASIGAVVGLPGDDASVVLRLADEAMHTAKRERLVS